MADVQKYQWKYGHTSSLAARIRRSEAECTRARSPLFALTWTARTSEKIGRARVCVCASKVFSLLFFLHNIIIATSMSNQRKMLDAFCTPLPLCLSPSMFFVLCLFVWLSVSYDGWWSVDCHFFFIWNDIQLSTAKREREREAREENLFALCQSNFHFRYSCFNHYQCRRSNTRSPCSSPMSLPIAVKPTSPSNDYRYAKRPHSCTDVHRAHLLNVRCRCVQFL